MTRRQALTLTRRQACRGLAGLAGAAVLLAAAPVLAQSLKDLRAQGIVGEGYDGFARVRTPASGAQAAVDQANARRREIYAKRAAEQKVSPADVGRVYARQIFDKAPPGTWFLQENGQWVRK
jgi:uncharacterized protein YdbL (DUF1318 family)